jgi:hypothetical protein
MHLLRCGEPYIDERRVSMTTQISYTKYENQLLPGFREKLNMAESTEDVRKFFIYTIRDLFNAVFEEKLDMDHEDIGFDPDRDPPYYFGNRPLAHQEFSSAWNGSDLPRVVNRLADSAVRRYRHLEKNPEKTNSKIRN